MTTELECTTLSSTEALNVSGCIKLRWERCAKSNQWKENFRSGQRQTVMTVQHQRLLTHLALLHWWRWHSSRWQSAWSIRRKEGKQIRSYLSDSACSLSKIKGWLLTSSIDFRFKKSHCNYCSFFPYKPNHYFKLGVPYGKEFEILHFC